MDSLIGRRLGQYEILAKLGAGGMATVYRARQISVDRDVAIKIIRPDLIEEVGFAERFQREARTIASLSHLHILKVFDYGQENNLAYLVMELLEGGSLSRLLREHGPLLPTQAARMVDQIGQALDYAHERGVIHRDLKPDNVLLDNAQNCFLTDFGIAKLLNETTRITRTGLVMGTPAYMAPELWSGQAADARTDIYALGVILYEMLVGKSPFVADTPFRVMHMHIYEPLPPASTKNPTVPQGTDEVLAKALHKDREQRFISAGILAAAFQSVANGQMPTDLLAPEPMAGPLTAATPAAVVPGYVPTPTPRPPAPLLAEPEASPPRRSGLLVLLMVGLLIVIAILGVAAFSLLNENNTRQTQTAAAVIMQTQVALQKTIEQLTAVAVLPPISPTPGGLVQVITPTAETPDSTLTETPTATATFSATPTATLTGTPTATLTETPTATLTETPTSTLTETPTLDLEALVAMTLAPEQTKTTMAQQIEQTVNAIFLANQATNNAALTTRTAEAEQTQAVLATLTAEAQQTQAVLATRTAEAQQTQIALNAAIEATTNALQLMGTLNAERTAVAANQQTLAAYASPTPLEGICPNFSPTRLVIGEYARVTPGDPNRLRSAPNSSNIVATVPGGSAIQVLDGPTCTISGDGDGLAWWKVEWQGYQGWTAEGKGSTYWIEPLGPVLPATYVAKRTPPPTDQRRAAPSGSTLLGDFQVEWYCTDRGYGVILVNSQRDWACTNKSNNRVAFTLKAADFDAICRSWYNDTGAFAIQDMTKAVAAYNWRCYTFR
jgi:serine/threonine-protein kinase